MRIRNFNLIILSLLFLNGCASSERIQKSRYDNAKYQYSNETKILNMSFEFFSDGSFVFELKNGLLQQYSSGNFVEIGKDSIAISSTGDNLETMPNVSWMQFDGEVIVFYKKKMQFKEYVFTQQKKSLNSRSSVFALYPGRVGLHSSYRTSIKTSVFAERIPSGSNGMLLFFRISSICGQYSGSTAISSPPLVCGSHNSDFQASFSSFMLCP